MAKDSVVSDAERWYDHMIDPQLRAIAEQCRDKGMAFVAIVEYEPGCRAVTDYVPPEAGLGMRLLRLMAQAGSNIELFEIEQAMMAADQPEVSDGTAEDGAGVRGDERERDPG